MNAATPPIRLLIADDQGLLLGALSALLELEDDLDVVARVARGDEVLAAAQEHQPDVCLLDIEMPGLDGIDACRMVVTQTTARVLIVTPFGRTGYLRRAMEAGASGFIVKDTPVDELAEAVRQVHRGSRVVDPNLATDSLIEGVNPLSQRETEVLRIALTGVPVSAIAAELHLSGGTVRNHLSAAIGKTGASTRVEAAQVARARGWL